MSDELLYNMLTAAATSYRNITIDMTTDWLRSPIAVLPVCSAPGDLREKVRENRSTDDHKDPERPANT